MVLQVILGLDHTDHREQKQRRIAGGGAVMYSLYLKQALVKKTSSTCFEQFFPLRILSSSKLGV